MSTEIDSDALLPCVICHKRLKQAEPFIMVAYLAGGARDMPAVGNAPVHLGCHITAIAGEAAELVANDEQAGLSRRDGESLNQVLGALLAELITDDGPRRRSRRG